MKSEKADLDDVRERLNKKIEALEADVHLRDRRIEAMKQDIADLQRLLAAERADNLALQAQGKE